MIRIGLKLNEKVEVSGIVYRVPIEAAPKFERGYPPSSSEFPSNDIVRVLCTSMKLFVSNTYSYYFMFNNHIEIKEVKESGVNMKIEICYSEIKKRIFLLILLLDQNLCYQLCKSGCPIVSMGVFGNLIQTANYLL